MVTVWTCSGKNVHSKIRWKIRSDVNAFSEGGSESMNPDSAVAGVPMEFFMVYEIGGTCWIQIDALR
jgi:hypothetical protein